MPRPPPQRTRSSRSWDTEVPCRRRALRSLLARLQRSLGREGPAVLRIRQTALQPSGPPAPRRQCRRRRCRQGSCRSRYPWARTACCGLPRSRASHHAPCSVRRGGTCRTPCSRSTEDAKSGLGPSPPPPRRRSCRRRGTWGCWTGSARRWELTWQLGVVPSRESSGRLSCARAATALPVPLQPLAPSPWQQPPSPRLGVLLWLLAPLGHRLQQCSALWQSCCRSLPWEVHPCHP
mmetsp:Transcript_24836/g.51639  ORF Transcript_24836/g.51639 Transcript_24836/m.51639 type:complete len:235 (+) Transcript_24836:185-889(+)